ncbi:MAG TPA: outer membrane protein assembly factor BamE [Rhodospirillaceae bacterium]|nr:outer membrane protein assembly factor BamE [Rhodospirillaceae bacterium]
MTEKSTKMTNSEFRLPSPRRAAALLTAAVLVSATLSGCATRVAVRGNLPDSERLAEVVPGDMSREEVAEILGSPSSVTPFDSDLWLYISEKTETFAFMAPEVVERNVIMVKFTDKGIVNEVKKLDLSNAQDVKHVERVTPTSGNEVTFWDQLFHNVGRFNTGDSGLDPSGN